MIDYLKQICHRIKTLIQATLVVNYNGTVVDDTGDARTGFFYIAGRAQKGYILTPYGLCTNPPEGSSGLAMNMNGGGTYPTAILDYAAKRFKNLEPGEVVVGNYLKGTYAKFDSNGDVQVFTQGKVFLTGDVVGATADAPVSMPNGIIVNGAVIDELHTHSGVQTGGGVTGGVVV